MSIEQNESSAFYGDDGHGGGNSAAPGNAGEASGQDVSEGTDGSAGASNSRRRRRRRKTKAGGPAPAQPAENGEAEQPIVALVSLPTPAAPPVSASPQGVHANGGNGKRKKRKRRGGAGAESAAAPAQAPAAAQAGGEQPRPRQSRPNGAWKRREEGPDGNREGARGSFGGGEHFSESYGNGGGGRRRGRFGGVNGSKAGFVGPMDHSYRTANGNVADGSSPAAQARMVNGNLRRYDDADIVPIAVIREDVPARIICFIEDLFVVTKLQETARKMGVKVQFAKADKETLAAITDAPEGERASLIVFDLNNAGAKPLTTIPKLKAKLKRGTSVIGFLQHIQGDLKLKAIEAGCDSVMAKAAFSQNVPNLLRRHGVAEEELAEA